jgi:hypothetical protein
MSHENVHSNSYDAATQYFSEIGNDNNEISSIIEFGTRRAFGLSDLDIMVIVDSGAAIRSRPVWSDYDSYPQHVKDSLDGGAVKIVTESQFTSLPVLGAMNVHVVFGETIDQDEPDERTRRLVNLIDVMDWLAERIVTLSAHTRSHAAHATRAINCAYSITHTFRRAYEAGAIGSEVSTTYRLKVDEFREAWRTSPESASGRLVSWLVECLSDAMKLSVMIAAYVESKSLYFPPAANEQHSFRFDNGKLGFVAPSLINDEDPGCLVPSVWLTHLVAQSQLGGTIPSTISSRLSKGSKKAKTKVSPAVSDLLSIRMKLCNAMADTLLPLGMRNNVYRFGHLLKP